MSGSNKLSLHKVRAELFKFFILSNPLELCSGYFPGQLGGINKDPTVWPDGTRPPPKCIFKKNKSLMNSKIEPTLTLHRLRLHLNLPLALLKWAIN